MPRRSFGATLPVKKRARPHGTRTSQAAFNHLRLRPHTRRHGERAVVPTRRASRLLIPSVARRVRYRGQVKTSNGSGPGPGMLTHRPGHQVLRSATYRTQLRNATRVRDMSSSARAEDLADLAEVAEIMGLTNQRGVSVYRRRYADFPAPFVERGRCVLWVRADVEAWVERRR